MHIIESIILGLIQGITELFPISSSGHLLLIDVINTKLKLGLDFTFQNTNFDIVLHIATFFAIAIAYRSVVIPLIKGWRQESNKKLIINLLISGLPTMIVGGLLFVFGDDITKNVTIATIMLFVFGVVFVIIDLLPTKKIGTAEYKDLTPKSALIIGLSQAVAVQRGVSRSGITLLGGLSQKLSRRAALDYAFLASLPVFAVLALSQVFKLIKDRNVPVTNPASPVDLIIGFVVAFLVGTLVLTFFKKIINHKWALAAFGIYRIVIAIIIGILLVG